MTKAEHLRLVTWRSKILQHVAAESRTVAHTASACVLTKRNRNPLFGSKRLEDINTGRAHGRHK